MLKHYSLRLQHVTSIKKRRFILWTTVLTPVALIWFFRHLLYASWTLANLRLIWRTNASEFILSSEYDDFDISFASYSRKQLSAAPYDDHIPPILHHISLGKSGSHWTERWEETAQSCLDWHPGWQSHLWTDDTASKFVADKFPELKDMWENYPYLVERIDALRYMVLYEYGGAILDMDLKCKRALGPLRRFSFVAPEANPTGFSIGFMMASKHNALIGDILRNLTVYDRRWLGVPYATVMFSTGCHFASVIHAYQFNRTQFKILPGPMHSLSGRVSTPLFDHLGSSSWHSYDARLIVMLSHRFNLIFCFGFGVTFVLYMRRTNLRQLSNALYARTSSRGLS